MKARELKRIAAGLAEHLFQSPFFLLPMAPLFWSGNFILGRFVRNTLPPVGLTFWRWVVASIIITAISWPYLKKDLPVIMKNRRIILFLAFLSVTVFNALAYMGLRSTSAINGVLMQSALPVVIVIMNFLLFRETVRPLQALGIAISLGGVMTIISGGDPWALLSLSLNRGDVIILIAVFCYAAYSSLLRKRPPIHQLSFLSATFISGAAMLFPFYILELIILGPMPVNEQTILAIGYVAVFPSIISYFSFNRGVELVGAGTAGLFIHLMPVFGSIMAVFFLGEKFHFFHGAGIVLILAGIYLATRVGTRSNRSDR